MMAQAPSVLLLNAVATVKSTRAGAIPRLFNPSKVPRLVSSFKSGSPLVIRISSRKSKSECQAYSISIKCEQSAKESNGLDIWLGRLAMIGFATAITIEVATGKGLLENFGFITPVPTLALIVTALVGVLTAIFIFQSASRD